MRHYSGQARRARDFIDLLAQYDHNFHRPFDREHFHNGPREPSTPLLIPDRTTHQDFRGMSDLITGSRQILAHHNPETLRHSDRVADISELIAKTIGWTASRIAQIKIAGLLHDIGTIVVESYSENKFRSANKQEVASKNLRQVNPSSEMIQYSRFLPPTIRDGVSLYHHRFDTGASFSAEGAIVGIADAVDKIAYIAGYDRASSMQAVQRELTAQRGTTYHPDFVGAFLDALPEFQANIQKNVGLYLQTGAKTLTLS